MATDTKKRLEEEFTKAPQAKTAEDVNNQDARTRLWQSLNTAYGQQMEESDKAYDKAISQQDNAMMARGMGRSSYAGQIRANMYNDKANARNRLGENLIADYQNRIGEIEAQEKEDERWNKQFAENQRQFNASQELTRSENALNRQSQIDLQKMNQEWQGTQNALNREHEMSMQEASQTFQTNLTKLQQAFQADESAKSRQAQKDLQLLQQEWSSKENKLSRDAQEALQRLQIEANKAENAANRELQVTLQQMSQAFTAKENAANRAQNQSQFEAQLAETHQQNTIQNQQWQQQFNANQQQQTIANQQWEQQFNANQQQQTIANQQWEQQFIADQNYKSQQLAQWREQFDYDKLSNLQKVSMEKVMAIIQNGNDPDDTLLGQAGMTRAEANGMKAQVAAGGGSTSNPGAGTPDWQTAGYDSAEDMAEAQNNGYTNANEWKAYKLLNEGKGIWSGLPGNVQSGSTTQSTSDDTNNRLKNITRRT